MVAKQSFFFAIIIALSINASANDRVYVRGINKVYALLPASHRSKSIGQMQAESTAGRNKFARLLEMDSKTKADLLNSVTPVKDQGHRGTCVAFASVAMIESQVKQATGKDVDLSEQYIYWESKAVAKVGPHEEGSEPIDMLQAIDIENPSLAEAHPEVGVPLGAAWPYEKTPWYADKDNHPDCVKAFARNEDKLPTECITNGAPPEAAVNAQKITVSKAQKVPSSPEAIVGLLSEGVAVEVGLDVYQNAWALGVKKDDPNAAELIKQHLAGIVLMPKPGDVAVGGHAILIVGYDKQSKAYLFKNSWGTNEWASKAAVPGFGIIPMAYVQKYGEAVIAKANISTGAKNNVKR